MSQSKLLTESRLHEALQRLLKGDNYRVARGGRLTLNKINNEAGLSNSYIHKFPDFVLYAKPIIEEFNYSQKKLFEDTDLSNNCRSSEIEILKVEIARERRLKIRYRKERDDALKIKCELEALNNTLMYRVYELQDELMTEKGIIKHVK